MKTIRQLSASVINKIAAGEVIERPASVVKELLENSVDAGATRIELSLENGGMESIRVTDNGSGIPQDQLTLAVTSHATSKIIDADDLFRVGSFGFRGEALASITEVSQAVIRSRPSSQECGYELEINGGHHQSIQPCGCPVGTSIEIKELFYNTPVRGKFLKTPQTERGHITEAFTRIALANPQIGMNLLHNDKVVYQLPATENWTERIDAFFGREISGSLIQVANHDHEVRISGYVVDPSVSRANNRMQYLFLNRRYIRDRSLQHALSEAYRGLLMTGRFPICFLQMDMPYELVDVNVHPAKLEVRFQNAGQIYSQLLSVIRNRFLTTDLTAYAQLSNRSVPDFKPFPGQTQSAMHSSMGLELGSNQVPVDSFAASGVVDQASVAGVGIPALQPDGQAHPFSLHAPQQPAEQTRLNFPPMPATDLGNLSGSSNFRTDASASATSASHNSVGSTIGPLAIRPLPDTDPFLASFSKPSAAAGDGLAPAPWQSEPSHTAAHAAHTALGSPHRSSFRVPALQVHNTYLIQETDEGMLVVDQHALHERILYEHLRKKFEAGNLESQRLLVPEPVALPAAEAAAVLENADTLKTLGVEVEPFGGDTVLVTAYPAMLANQSPNEMISNIVDKLMGENSKQLNHEDLIDELLHMISCKAAIKAGDKLSPEEIATLLEHREQCENSHHCPHGRPTSLVFSRAELDRRFKRV